MSIVDGVMYPEMHPLTANYNALNILDIGGHSVDIQHQLNILKSYSDQEGKGDSCGVSILPERGIEYVNKDFIIKHDIGIIYHKNGKLSGKRLKEIGPFAKYIVDERRLLSELEAYLLGNNVFISFEHPVSNLVDAASKYIMTYGLADKYLSMSNENKDYSNYLRSIANNIHSVAYAVDNINFLIQKRNMMNRVGNKRHYGSLEINYHLNNFYFLIASSFDIVARLINQLYHLGLRHYGELGVDKKKLQKELFKKDEDMHGVISNPDSQSWLERIKLVRNAVAHESAMSNSNLLKEKPKDEQLSTEEIDKLVDIECGDMGSLNEELIRYIREGKAYGIRIENNYDRVSEDALCLETRNGEHAIFNPIISLGYDFDKMQEYLWDIIGKINW